MHDMVHMHDRLWQGQCKLALPSQIAGETTWTSSVTGAFAEQSAECLVDIGAAVAST